MAEDTTDAVKVTDENERYARVLEGTSSILMLVGLGLAVYAAYVWLRTGVWDGHPLGGFLGQTLGIGQPLEEWAGLGKILSFIGGMPMFSVVWMIAIVLGAESDRAYKETSERRRREGRPAY